MDSEIIEIGLDWFAGEFARHAVMYLPWLLATGGVAVLGVLMFGRGYKNRIAEQGRRIRDLERQVAERATPVSQPAVMQQQVNVGAGESEIREVRKALERIESRGIELDDVRTIVGKLPQVRVGDTATYAELPDGTRVVTLADGSIRLALPVLLSGRLELQGTGRTRGKDEAVSMAGIPELERCQQALVKYMALPTSRMVGSVEIAGSAELYPYMAELCHILDEQEIPHPEIDYHFSIVDTGEWAKFLGNLWAVRHDIEKARLVYQSGDRP